tara:strand:- start:522 stop:854 length:333 start_codon:yes stop_codon:yes gene_type:complete
MGNNPKHIMITFDFIDNIEADHETHVAWDDIIYVMERINNDISKDVSLGHVFNIRGEVLYLELFFEKSEDSREFDYIVDDYKVISSDRYLDLILDNRKVTLDKTRIREII